MRAQDLLASIHSRDSLEHKIYMLAMLEIAEGPSSDP